MNFSQVNVREQMQRLLDEQMELPLQSPGDLTVVRAKVCNRNVTVVGFDFTDNAGTLGHDEAKQLEFAIDDAVSARHPLLLLLNSAGVRVQEKEKALASYKGVLRHILDSKLDGLTIISLVMDHCYGGASIIAMLSDRIVLHKESSISVTGPKAIEQLCGRVADRSFFRAQIQHVISGASRAKISEVFDVVKNSPDGYKSALQNFLSNCDNLRSSLEKVDRELEGRTNREGLNGKMILCQSPLSKYLIEKKTSFSSELVWETDGAYFNRIVPDAQGANQFALIDNTHATVKSISRLTKSLSAVKPGFSRNIIFLDCPCHSPELSDEALILAQYISHLSHVIRDRQNQGMQVDLVIVGEAGGGLFVALAAACSQVVAMKGSNVCVLPKKALEVIGKEDEFMLSMEELMRFGVIDQFVSDLEIYLS